MGFARVWINWVMSCISTVSYTILLNGRQHGFIRPERGIRQGDPLSPFLFILCAEALVNKLNASAAHGNIQGICLGVGGPVVHHLLFADDSLMLCRANLSDSMELRSCLKLYGDASGQIINLQKSSIIFGSKVSEEAKLEVKEVLGIEKEGGEGTYLGLPECFKGSKRDLLDFLRERLKSRMHGWFAKSLSHGGKEVLLKSICLALPIYAMSVFKLPKDLCAKLTSAMTEFWWSSGGNKKKISWVAWSKLCKRKEEGGLGFHDIEKFNQALLGKQAWRIWSRPDSLVARVLKSRYFRSSNFLESSIGSRPSFAWRSLLHGRELLKEGLVRAVGDGRGTNVWAEKWIMNDVPKFPLYREDSVIDLTLTIADLFIPGTHRWNEALVRSTFTPEDAELILLIKPNHRNEDSYKWGLTKDGVYSSKSGYRFLETLQNIAQPQQGLPPIEKKLWSSIWKIKAPSKLKHFLWKVLAGAIAVKDRLRSRGIQLDVTCPVCWSATESICHLLFTCPVAQEVWVRSNIKLPSGGFSRSSVFLNIHHLLIVNGRKGDDLQNKSFLWIVWQIWKGRNELVFEKRQTSPVSILSKALEDASIWLEVNKPALRDQSIQRCVLSSPPRWSPPPAGSLKCNFGVAWERPHDYSGAAWILRDHNGSTLLHSRRSFSKVQSRTEAELLGFKFAVESMISTRKCGVIFESHYELVRDAMLFPQRYSSLQVLIHSIHVLLLSLNGWQCVHVMEGKNKPASDIAYSVVRDRRLSSYIACGSPHWLQACLNAETTFR